MNIVLAIIGSKIGRGALIGLGALFALWLWGQKKEREGYAQCKAEWAQAEQKAIERAEQARADAESHIDSVPDDGLRDDPYNRDNH
jgi:hypothetical protein